MKRKRVSTNILIDEICPNLTCVYYPDGTQKWVRRAITLEDFENKQAETRWVENQLARNRRADRRLPICERREDAGEGA